MKVLVATDKPFAKVAVDGIRKEIEAAGYELVLLEKYGEKAKLLEAVKDVNAIIIRSDIIDAEVLDAAKELKIVDVQEQVMITWIWRLLRHTMCVL